jgi:hypothetical protein
LPAGLFLWLLLTGTLLTLFRFDVVIVGLVATFFISLVASRTFSKVELPTKEAKTSLFSGLKGYILTTCIVLTTGLSYPFFRQNSQYSRLQATALVPPEEDTPQDSDLAENRTGKNMSVVSSLLQL